MRSRTHTHTHYKVRRAEAIISAWDGESSAPLKSMLRVKRRISWWTASAPGNKGREWNRKPLQNPNRTDEGCRGRPGLAGCLRPERVWISSLLGRFRALGYLYSQALFWVFFSSCFLVHFIFNSLLSIVPDYNCRRRWCETGKQGEHKYNTHTISPSALR